MKKSGILAIALVVVLIGGIVAGAFGMFGGDTGAYKGSDLSGSRGSEYLDENEDRGSKGTARDAIFNREPTAAADPPDISGFSPSEAFDDNGYFTGIDALMLITSLPDYAGIHIPTDVHNITDEDVDAELESYFQSREGVEVRDSSRVIAFGDYVNLDYVGTIDGTPFDGGDSEGLGITVQAGSSEFISDFLTQIIGSSPGDVITVNVTFPAEYPNAPELQNKPAVFEVTINYIFESAEVTDEVIREEFYERFGWSTVTELREGVRDLLKKDAARGYVVHQLDSHLMEIADTVTLPEQIQTYVDRLMASYFQSEADSYGIELNAYLQNYVGVADFPAALEMYAEDNHIESVWMLLIQAIAETEKIVVTDDDVADYVFEQSGSRDYSLHLETYGMGYLKQQVLLTVVLDYILTSAIFE